MPVPASSPSFGESSEASELRTDLASPDDYVVRVVAGQITCTGTLIETDQVLTAHHCLSERSATGALLNEDVEPTRIRVELGGDYLPWGEVGVRAIVAPSCGFAAGEGDIAILVLDRRLSGMPLPKLRLDEPPELGEGVQPVGFGRCAEVSDGIRRSTRLGGTVERLGSGRFRLQAAICPGDSGGPGIGARNDEVLGVISASVMDESARTRGLSEFTRLDRWRAVFSNAKLISEGVGPAELPPIECSPPEHRTHRAKP